MKIARLLKLPPAKWEAAADRMATRDRSEIVRELDALLDKAARLRGYFDERHGYGCGDQGHKSAVKECNRLGAKIRRTLGYSYPRQDIHF